MTRGYVTLFPYAVAFAAGFVTMAYEMLLGSALPPTSGAPSTHGARSSPSSSSE